MIYLDASFLFSLYCTDANSRAALSLVATTRAQMIISSLCEFEVVNALSLCIFRKELVDSEVFSIRRMLQKNIASGAYMISPLPENTFSRATVLSRTITPVTGVRAADLLHIAAALELGAATLYTFDQEQSKAAHAAGLIVN